MESETQDAALNPHAIQMQFKQSLSSLKPTHLTSEQMERINEQLRILGQELKASKNVTAKSRKKEHITALKELKTLSQSMDVLYAIQQIEDDVRFQHVKAGTGSRTWILMEDIKNEHSGRQLKE